MFYTPRHIIFIMFILVCTEYGGDSVLRIFPIDRGTPDLIFKVLISFMALFFMISFGLKIPNKISLIMPFILFMGVIFFGFFHGLISNNPVNAINETIPFLFIVLFLSFSAIKKPLSSSEIEFGLKILVYIVTFKILFYLIASYLFYGIPSWKILVKQSPLMLIALSVFLSKITAIKKPKENINLLLFLITLCIVFSSARMLFLASLFTFCAYFLNRRLIQSFRMIAIVGISFTIYLIVAGGGITYFSTYLYAGEVFEEGMAYRLVQLDIIINRLINSPFLGVGFGYFNTEYLTYGLLAKPYQLELDILNFISKIGAIGTFFYGLAYFLLFRLIDKITDEDIKRISKSLFISLIAFMIYSLGQTAHQGVTYWIYLAFVYGFVVSHLKAQYKISS